MTDAVLRPGLTHDPRLAAGFSTRAYASADKPLDAVRARLARGERFGAVASVGQVHGSAVAVVREGGHVPAHDGLATDVPGLLLTVISADCALVLLADPDAGVVGACHSGWRGTVAGVVGETVRAMERLGARAGRTRAFVGPCISAEAFEVGDEVAAHFPETSVVRRPDWARPHIDLRADLARQLAEVGVTDVELSDACTATETARFYSYRAEEGTTGRMVGFVGLRGAVEGTSGA
ncbi:MAG TPA: peptidoglycan editing factor PgeF [Rubricoccaceae bacterium]